MAIKNSSIMSKKNTMSLTLTMRLNMINLRKKISPRRWRLSQATHTLPLMPSLSSILSISTRLSIPNQSQSPTTLLNQLTTIHSQPTTILSQTITNQFTTDTTAGTLTHLQHSTPSAMIPSMQTCTQPILHQHSTSSDTGSHTTNLTFLITNHMCQSLTYLTTQSQNLSQCQNLTTQFQNQFQNHTTQNQSQFQNHTTHLSLSQKKTFVYAIIQNMKIKSSNSSGKRHSYKIRSRPLWEQSLTLKDN